MNLPLTIIALCIISFLIPLFLCIKIGFWLALLAFISFYLMVLWFLFSIDPSGQGVGWVVLLFLMPTAITGVFGLLVGGVIILPEKKSGAQNEQ